jgi:hypothetical protein
MTPQPVAGLRAASALLGLLLLVPGCNSETKSEASTSPPPNGADYGPNKLPPAERLAPRANQGPRAPGAPPLRR